MHIAFFPPDELLTSKGGKKPLCILKLTAGICKAIFTSSEGGWCKLQISYCCRWAGKAWETVLTSWPFWRDHENCSVAHGQAHLCYCPSLSFSSFKNYVTGAGRQSSSVLCRPLGSPNAQCRKQGRGTFLHSPAALTRHCFPTAYNSATGLSTRSI